LNEGLREIFGEYFSDSEITINRKKSSVCVRDNSCEFLWFDSELDHHLISLEVHGEYKLTHVSIDG